MPNFNTSAMKVAIYPVAEKKEQQQQPLPKESVEKLKALIVYCINREEDLNVVIAFVNHYFSDSVDEALGKILNNYNCKVHTDQLGLLIFFTEANYMITLKFQGGSGKFINWIGKTKTDRSHNVKKKTYDDDSSDDSTDDAIENAAGLGLTQECAF